MAEPSDAWRRHGTAKHVRGHGNAWLRNGSAKRRSGTDKHGKAKAEQTTDS
jgi:hypothetical protein